MFKRGSFEHTQHSHVRKKSLQPVESNFYPEFYSSFFKAASSTPRSPDQVVSIMSFGLSVFYKKTCHNDKVSRCVLPAEVESEAAESGETDGDWTPRTYPIILTTEFSLLSHHTDVKHSCCC